MKATKKTAITTSGSRLEQTCDPVSRLVIVFLLLPASWAVSSGFRNWISRLRRGAVPRELLADPSQVMDSVINASRGKQLFTCLPLNAALALHARQGIVPVLKACWRICKSESFAGIWWRLFRRVPVHVSVCTTTDKTANRQERILVIDYRIPKHDVSAGNRATWGILHDLVRTGYAVTFMPATMYNDKEYTQQLEKESIEIITKDSGYTSPAQFLAQKGSSFGVFYLIRLDVAEDVLALIRKVAPKSRILFHAPDVTFLREQREAALLHDDTATMRAMQTKKRELAVMNAVDHVVAISVNDAKSLQENGMRTPLTIFPGLYAPVQQTIKPVQARKDIFFLGGFTHKPNIDAVMWFTAEIWPLIHAALPDVQCHIVGSEAPESVLRLNKVPGIVVDGFVRDLDSFMEKMRLHVAPLRFGAGIKGKIAMTMGAGVPCICTTIAAEGMHITDRQTALVEDEATAFAEAVIRLYDDTKLWDLLSQNGCDLVRRFFGEQANFRSLLTVLNEAQALPVSVYINYCKNLPACSIERNTKKVAVSILVPVYNQWEMTRTCLNSVIEDCKRTDISIEIILSDDGSIDETVDAEKHYPGIRHLKTEKNRGFLRNCNEGAREAHGKYILFLNNDTIVMPGWIASLYKTAEEDTSIAIVGSKMLYPDEKIQEAGCVIFADANGMNVGRGMDRFLAPLNTEREVDYCSGCSLLVRKTFWERADGFDEQYTTAYFEDSDLAMTAHAQGLRVVYQPASEVIHFEGISYNDSKKDVLMNANRQLFREKWAAVLKTHLPDSSPWNIAMYHAGKLFASDK